MSPVHDKSDIEAVDNLHNAYSQIKSEIAKVIIGQDKVIEQFAYLDSFPGTGPQIQPHPVYA
jgi:hypothetical protein